MAECPALPEVEASCLHVYVLCEVIAQSGV